MRILVFGDSNSVMKSGWTSGLRAALPEATIDIVAVGGSVSFQFACHMEKDFSSYDLAIMDSGPNDERFAAAGHSVEYLARVFFEICSSIASKTRLVILGFPIETSLESPSAIHQRKHDLAATCGAQFIDVRDIVLRLSNKILGESEKRYEDFLHPNRKTSGIMGFQIGLLLASGLLESLPRHRAEDFSHHFTAWHGTYANGHLRTIRKNNSLLSADFVVVQPNEVLEIPDLGSCLGFYVDKSDTKMRVDAHAWDGTSKELSLRYRDPPGGFAMYFQHLSEGVHLKTLTGLPRRDNDPTLLDEYRNLPEQALLSNFAFWAGTRKPISTLNHDADVLHAALIESLSRDAATWRAALASYSSGISFLARQDNVSAEAAFADGMLKIPADEPSRTAFGFILKSIRPKPNA